MHRPPCCSRAWPACRVWSRLGRSSVAGCGREAPEAARKRADRRPRADGRSARTSRSPRSTSRRRKASQAVNIQARVSGWLDKRVYQEGAVVKNGQVIFQMDPKPFQAQLDAATGGVAAQPGGAAGRHCRTSIARSRSPQQNALSQKDLDDATGQYEQARAAVAAGEGAGRHGAAQPLLHHDPLAGGRRVELRARRRRHLPRPPTRSSRRSRCCRRCGSTSASRKTRWSAFATTCAPASSSCPKAASSSCSRDGRRRPLSVHRRHHVRGPFVQPHHGHFPAARDGQQPRRRAAAQPVRARSPHRLHPAERGGSPAALRAAERERPFRLGRQRPEQGGAAPRHRRRMEGRRLVHFGRPRQRRQGGRRRRRAALGGCGRESGPLHAAPPEPSPRPTAHDLRTPPPPLPQSMSFSTRDSPRWTRTPGAPSVSRRPRTSASARRLVITGYADKTGNAAANVELAKSAPRACVTSWWPRGRAGSAS